MGNYATRVKLTGEKCRLLGMNTNGTASEFNNCYSEVYPIKPRPKINKTIGTGTGIKILIAEDDGASRELLKQIFEKAGYNVTTVSDGSDIIDEMVGCDYKLLITDIRMPTSGTKVMDFIKQLNVQLPVIAVTACNKNEINKDDFSYVFGKPLDVKDLLEAVRISL